MPRTARVFAAAALGAVLAAGAVLLLRGHAEKAFHQLDFAAESTAVTCRGSVVELEFDPAGRIEARTGGEQVAEAGIHSDQLNEDVCGKTGPPRELSFRDSWYTLTSDRTTLTCYFPGHFLVKTSPSSASWAGERPAGRSVSLVLERRDRLSVAFASGSVLERTEESTLYYMRRHCTPTSG